MIMRRKLIRQGKSTLTVSLPKKWVEKNNLNDDDEIEINDENNLLTLSCFGSVKKRKKEIEINLTSEHIKVIKLLFRMIYKLGYHKIKIRFQNKSAIKKIKQILRNHLIGFEIVKFSDNSCEIDSITEPSTEKVEVLTSRIFHIIENCFDILINDLKNNDLESFQQIKNRSEAIDRYCNFCLRVYAENKDDKLLSYTQLFTFLTLLGHSFLYLYENCSYSQPQDIAFKYLNETKKFYNLIKKSFLSTNISYVNKAITELSSLLYKGSLQELKKDKNSPLIYYVSEIIRITYNIGGPCLSIILIEETIS